MRKHALILGITLSFLATMTTIAYRKQLRMASSVQVIAKDVLEIPVGKTRSIENQSVAITPKIGDVPQDRINQALAAKAEDTKKIFAEIAENIPELKPEVEQYQHDLETASRKLEAYKIKMAQSDEMRKLGKDIDEETSQSLEKEKQDLLEASKELGQKGQIINSKIMEYFESRHS